MMSFRMARSLDKFGALNFVAQSVVLARWAFVCFRICLGSSRPAWRRVHGPIGPVGIAGSAGASDPGDYKASRVPSGPKVLSVRQVPSARQGSGVSKAIREIADRQVPRENGAFRGPGESRAKWVRWVPKALEERRGRLARRVLWVRKALEGYRGIWESADPWGPKDSEVLPEKPVRWA